MLNDYALIIGVESYRAYDPSGASDVPGALNDARALIHQCLAMGFSPERIRVLTSPALSAASVGPGTEGIHFGEATRDQLVAGLTWIYGQLAAPAPSAGLCTFSGHGLMSPDLVLCAADFDGNAGSLVTVAQVRDALGDGKAARNLTVLLDCCHAQGDATRSVAARLAALAPGLGGGGAIAERLIAACRVDQTSVASRFAGVMQGAFTWAVTAAMGQWKATEERGVARLDVSYGELRNRTRELLAALSFDQVPVLAGPAGVATLPFLHPGEQGTAGEATQAPDAVRPRRQIGPGAPILQINYGAQGGPRLDQASTVVAHLGNVYATDSSTVYIAGMPASPQTEYWYVDATKLAQLQHATSLYFGSRDLEAGVNYVLSTFVETTGIVYAETTRWQSTSKFNDAESNQSSYVFQGSDSGQPVYVQLILESGSGLIVGIYWYLPQSMQSVTPSGVYPRFDGSLPGGSWQVNTTAPVSLSNQVFIKWGGPTSPPPSAPESQYGLGLASPQGASAVAAPGTAVLLATSASTWTRWLVSTTTGRIHLASNLNLVIDVNASSSGDLTDGLTLVLNYVDEKRPSQKWTWTTSGAYQIIARGDTGYVMDYNTAASTSLGNAIQIWTEVNSDPPWPPQQWALVTST